MPTPADDTSSLPSGTDVRRRRRVQVACLAAAVVLAGAGVAVEGAVGKRNASTHPSSTPAELDSLAARAMLSLAGDLPVTVGTRFGMTGQTRYEQHGLSHAESSPLRWVKGFRYDLVARCLGPGTVVVAWEAPGGPAGTMTVNCEDATARIRFIPRTDGPVVQLRVRPDAQATGRAGLAVGAIEYGDGCAPAEEVDDVPYRRRCFLNPYSRIRR